MKKSYILLFLFLISFVMISPVLAQEKEKQTTDSLTEQAPPSVELSEEDEEEEKEEPEKKKRKKNVFYGIKTKKGFTRTGFGNKEVIEQFYLLKEKDTDYKALDQYVRDIYWFDKTDKRIRRSPAYKIDKENALILHGTYKKILVENDQVLEQGIFYKGTKHGRWEQFNSKDILIDKEKYYKGWPKESIISYYDEDRQKLKEVIPVEYGKKEGYYYYFFENGRVAVTGEYQFDQKVGVWKEYHIGRARKKREIQYREDPWNDNFTPFIKREWDVKGKLLYENKKKPGNSY